MAEPRKSDVLARREQHLRDKEAKAAATSASVTGRSESSRNVTPSTLPERSSNLPSRPDAPIPSHRMLERHQPPRHGDRRDGRDGRDSRDARDSRDPRLPDSNRLERPGERSREFPGSDRRDPGLRDFSRASDREPPPARERARPDPPPRWTADSARENAERAANNARGETAGRLSRDANMPPPRSSAASSDRGPQVNSERQELINPERAALISGGKEPSRSDSPRRARDDPRDRPSSRPQSPRRHVSDRDLPESRRDDRASRNGHTDAHTPSRRGEESQPPAGPRSERPTDRASDRISSDRPRDASAFQPTQPPSRQVDPDHGRLNSSTRQALDPNYGRLNAAPVPDIPSGPRGRDSRGNRMPNAPPPRRDGRLPAEAPRPPTPEKQVPTGPSSTRQPRRSASGQFDQLSNAIGSTPNTPATASPAAGIHPDRLKHLGPQATQSPQPSQPPTPTASAGIHPDRLKALNETATAPSAHQPSNGRPRPPMPSVVTGGPPSGPKGSQSSPISSGPNGLSAPTGPASTVERARGGRRQLAGINTTLQQAGQQNGPDRMNVRGRGATRMSSGVQPETPISAPPTPVVPPPPPPPPGRPDLARDLINPGRTDLITGGGAPSGDERERDRTGGRRERSGRHSRRSSRSPPASDRTRDAKRGPPEEDRIRGDPKRGPPEDERPARGEHRDRRGGERELERDRHQGREPSREQGRDLMAGREGGRDRERERDRESVRRDGRDREGGRDAHDAGWAGGNERGGGGRRSDVRGDPRGEDRRDGRGSRDDASRKRRSDGEGMDRGHEKRPRR